MPQLLKITGVNPETKTVLDTSDDLTALYAERDRLQADSDETLTNLRYAVRLEPVNAFRPAETVVKKGAK